MTEKEVITINASKLKKKNTEWEELEKRTFELETDKLLFIARTVKNYFIVGLAHPLNYIEEKGGGELCVLRFWPPQKMHSKDTNSLFKLLMNSGPYLEHTYAKRRFFESPLSLPDSKFPYL